MRIRALHESSSCSWSSSPWLSNNLGTFARRVDVLELIMAFLGMVKRVVSAGMSDLATDHGC